MKPIRKNHPLRILFQGLVEHAFCTEVGLCNPRLTEYLTDLLVEFTHVDRLKLISRAEGKHLEQIASMLTAAETEDEPASGNRTERDRRIYRHIGDFTLFWAGVYPEQLKHTGLAPGNVLQTYASRGKRSYAMVSELAREDDIIPASLFRHLSEDFECCLYGLGLVRRGWEFGPTHPGDFAS